MSDFKKQLSTILGHGGLGVSISIGLRLGLFDALANFSPEKPATAEAIANQLNLKPRYVFEWLSAMACGEIIEVDTTGQNFWIAPEKREIIAGNKDPLFVTFAHLPTLGVEFENVLKVFKKDGPWGIDLHKNHGHHQHYHIMNDAKHASIKKHFQMDYLVKLGMNEKLEQGIDVLDVGCGPGMQIIELAQLFPKSRFVGFDVSDQSISKALKQQAELQLKNVDFLVLDAKEFKPEWESKFDLVISFDSFHHHNHPEKALKEVHRVLKPGGLFALIEMEGGTDNAYNDKKTRGPLSVFPYAWGLYSRKPEDEPEKGTVGMWSLWGIDKAKKMLEEAGFNDVKAEHTKMFDLNVLFLAKK